MTLTDKWKVREKALENLKQKLKELDEEQKQLMKQQAREYLEQEKIRQEQDYIHQELLEMEKQIQKKARLCHEKITLLNKGRRSRRARQKRLDRKIAAVSMEYKKLYAEEEDSR